MKNIHKKIELIQELVDTAYISHRDYIKSINVKEFNDKGDIIIEVDFYPGVLGSLQREEVLNQIWYIIFDFMNEPVFLSDVSDKKSNKLDESTNKETRILEKFLLTKSIEGVCGFFVDPEYDEKGYYWVYLMLDQDWLNSTDSDMLPIVDKYRRRLRKEISDFLGINVMVGSFVKKCN